MSAVDTRNLDRDSLFLMGELLVEGKSESVRAKIRNLSAGGMMAEGDIDVERGARVTVTLRNIGAVRGSVAWVQDNRIGVAFEEDIDPKLARAPSSSGKDTEVPSYARPAVSLPINHGWNGRLRKL
ncbi:PilZ domain-containing protein [Qipengyuania sp. MTN3-11]|uniref:PilZ domain-containing protein n=1 Tax=Qipengyuania sp. MTN3-11 TaxID=3056557 RepID=UPI0036F4243F